MQGTTTYEAAPQGAKHDSSKRLGGTSAGRALLRKKVNGFADMVQWVEDMPQDPQAASQYAASQNQASSLTPCYAERAVSPLHVHLLAIIHV